jgi:uncharacterized membrane protein YedE/YeeE
MEGNVMRIVLGTICLIVAATPAMAGGGGPAPAPLLGLGIPAAAIVGGVLFGSRFFKKK